MRRGHPTAWGTAYFDFAPQDGYTAPEQQIPDAWRILFITKHASADVLKGARSCWLRSRNAVKGRALSLFPHPALSQ